MIKKTIKMSVSKQCRWLNGRKMTKPARASCTDTDLLSAKNWPIKLFKTIHHRGPHLSRQDTWLSESTSRDLVLTQIEGQGNANNFDTTVNFCLSNIKISLDGGLFQEKGLLSLRRGVKLKRRRGMWKRPFNHDLKAKLHFAHQEMMVMAAAAAASCKSSMDYSLQLPLANSSNLWRNWIGQCR